MSCGSGVCECWRLTRDGVHGSTACVFYGMHWREVAALRPAADPEHHAERYSPDVLDENVEIRSHDELR